VTANRSVSFIAVLALAGAAAGAGAQDAFPTKPVRILATEAGGSSDVYARTIAQALTSRWGKQVIVDNRASVVAIETLIRAQPDGYSLLCYASSLWLGPLMQRGTYDPIRDVTPITIALSAPNVLAVNPAVPAKSVKELIALAKAKPGALNYGAGGLGSGGHLAAELLNSMAGINIVRISYKGAGPATNAVVTGDVQMIFATIGSVGPHVKSGRLRALAVGSAKPSPLVPDLPTVASVIPGFESTLIQGMFAPAKLSPAMVRKLHQDIVGVLAHQDVQEKLLAMGTEVVGSTPEALAQAMKADIARFGKILKEGGIKQE
jgi:tripartite-type tricarboxylate transporter receptor subunit TctC